MRLHLVLAGLAAATMVACGGDPAADDDRAGEGVQASSEPPTTAGPPTSAVGSIEAQLEGPPESGSVIVYRFDPDDRNDVMDALAGRLVALGVTEGYVGGENGPNGVAVAVPFPLDEAEALAPLLAGNGAVELRPVLEVVAGGCTALGEPTKPAEVLPTAPAVLPSLDPAGECFRVGPLPAGAAGPLDGGALTEPEPIDLGGEWGVAVAIADDHLDLFQEVTASCFARADDCPTGRLAVVLDGIVRSAPEVLEPVLTDDAVLAGMGPEVAAGALALALRGDIPVPRLAFERIDPL